MIGAVKSNRTATNSQWSRVMEHELFALVFHHYVEPLDAIRLARVCRLWHELSTDPRAWESADLRSCGHLVDDAALDGLCRGRRQLGRRALALSANLAAYTSRIRRETGKRRGK